MYNLGHSHILEKTTKFHYVFIHTAYAAPDLYDAKCMCFSMPSVNILRQEAQNLLWCTAARWNIRITDRCSFVQSVRNAE